ncbi:MULTISPECIES: tail fiber domain-containing protein [Clostridium]|uniref:Peptidase S74 domain-containing protein n=1 Tax=Clostridium acetobutylicum (strain ATCC 824 / DSM 792 / JCM 1419 / IAM 19013 / LMG 5710 / NBRC 13948 / NRRL B-527 / VKM B-1787 / 2291 / W) TaxID=272562 RepID=Q97K08_CLOAB|nr:MULTISPECIES: tail fiber domain-containing protein [Clostridium]AAK79087.1 Hypothetical protein CA_C1113 [Clostridium acetobutylicum ATCC 824]AWV81659.1 tail fiber domain-containing protein [Clostridium acetobutylicum]PSM04944.1 hypothetical protein C7T89_16480 [Clostridium sp. NJ4]TQD47109.1 tail fiber domain-containing protein [Clostridium acetobutylicum]
MTDDSNAITQNDLRKFVTGVILKIIDKRLSENKNTEIYPATIISTDSTNHYANIKITTGGQVSILNNVKNKSVNILNNGDKVFAVAPNGDLNNLYVGTNLIGNGINGQDIVANSIQANSIQANSITADEIQAGSITANEIASNTITAESGIIASLDAGKITTGVLSADRIDTNNLNARRITTPGSILHGTIGSWQEATQNINGFQLYNTQENRSVFRIADMNMTWAGDLLRYSVLQGNADGLILTPSNTTYNSNNSAEGFLDAAGQFIYLGGGTITLASGGQGGNSVNVSSSAIDIICNNTSANKGIGVSATAIEFEVGFDDGGKSWNYHLIRNTIDNGTSQDYYILSSRNVMDFIMNEDSNGLGVHCNNGTTYWAYNFNASDERLKTNIKPITTNCSSIINQINLKEFDFIKTGEHIEVGTIAQQLSKINKKFSKILYTTEDGTNFFAPDYNSILPYIIGAIQELSAKSKSLETRVTTLENSIQELKASK